MSDFDQERAVILKRIAEGLNDLAGLYAANPDRALPSVDEPTGSAVISVANADEGVSLHNVYPMSCQQAISEDEETVWGPVIYCILGLSTENLLLH